MRRSLAIALMIMLCCLTSFAALGYGNNTIWIDPEHDLVVVWRWHQANPDELIRRILASIND